MIQLKKKVHNMQLTEFKELLKKANMNKKKFCEITSLSYGTVNSWGNEGRAEVPEWVRPFLNNYIEAKKLKKIREIFDDKED